MVCSEGLVSVWSVPLLNADERKIIPGGPQPRNTLSRAAFPTGPAVNRKTAPNPRNGTQHALAVEIHKGGNVNSTSKTREQDEALPSPPSAKRRKLDHQASQVSPASSGQTDPLDRLSPHAISFHASQGVSRAPSRAPSASANSQASGLPMKRNGSFEYRKVEEMMDSKPKSKKQRRSDNQNYQADHKLLPSSPKRSSMSDPIDISGDESHITKTKPRAALRPTYQGTARQPPPTVNGTKSNSSRSLKDRVHPAQSPYFNQPGLPTPRANGNVKQKLISQNVSREKSPGLAQKFVATDGTRRGSDVNASSDADELQSAPTTVGQNADPGAVFTVKEMRLNSPSKHSSSTLKATPPMHDLTVLPPSTIKSDFSSSNAQSRNGGRPTRSAPRDQEAKPPWSVALAAISLPGALFTADDLGLVYDQKQGEYYIQRHGSAIRTPYSSLQIQPMKLNKILWERTGTKVRLESSRSGTEDNVLDLEFASERDLSDLLRRLQNSKSVPFSVVAKPGYVV